MKRNSRKYKSAFDNALVKSYLDSEDCRKLAFIDDLLEYSVLEHLKQSHPTRWVTSYANLNIHKPK